MAAYSDSEKDREQMVNRALEAYTGLLAVFPDDPDLTLGTAEAYRLLAAIQQTTGQIPQSIASFERSIAHFLKLVDNPQKKHEANRGLVWDYTRRGELYRMGISSELAQQDYRRARTNRSVQG